MSARIKVCCIASLDEARVAVDAGAWALGLVSDMPSGPGVIDEPLIARIALTFRGEVETFLLTRLQRVEAIVAQHRRCRTSTLQLCDRLEPGELSRLRAALPDVRLVQVVHVVDESAVSEAAAAEPWVDMLLLDSGNTALPVKELGGTGRVHDWSVSREIVGAVDRPVFLAGGLRPDNVGDAISRVAPYGVDLCSGIRTGNLLDPEKLARFVASVRAA